jgi:hypothetical protein
MSVGLAIAISTGFGEIVAPPVAGTTATEMATATASIVRTVLIRQLSGDKNRWSTSTPLGDGRRNKLVTHVRFGPKADILANNFDFRFASQSRRQPIQQRT